MDEFEDENGDVHPMEKENGEGEFGENDWELTMKSAPRGWKVP